MTFYHNGHPYPSLSLVFIFCTLQLLSTALSRTMIQLFTCGLVSNLSFAFEVVLKKFE